VSIRLRLTLVAAAAVALAVVLASALVFIVLRSQLRGEIDNSLRRSADEISRLPPAAINRGVFRFGPELGYPQVVLPDGGTLRPEGANVELPVDERALEVVRGERDAYLSDATVAGTHLRVITFRYGPGFAVQVARSLEEVDRTMARARTFLLLIALGGIALAAALGLVVSRAALAPVRRLERATETVAATGDLSERITVTGRDELSRLASRFNTMLGALEASSGAQRRLVADASHELRTPLTSLRTNIEVLSRRGRLPAGERQRLLDDVLEQLDEMTTLVAELMELAIGAEHEAEPEDVRLDLVASGAVERTTRNRPGVVFNADLEESVVRGVPSRIERAIGNLLDNAAKWSPAGAVVDVTVRGPEVTVRDRGPGISDDDLPYVFDRFYRSRSARGMPGSGLGLSIVRQVAESHGGSVVVERPEDGGTLVRLRLNGGPPNS
jgi:two-component system sensor histidine kinase MprB